MFPLPKENSLYTYFNSVNRKSDRDEMRYEWLRLRSCSDRSLALDFTVLEETKCVFVFPVDCITIIGQNSVLQKFMDNCVQSVVISTEKTLQTFQLDLSIANCTPAIRKCPICRAFIKETVKTYPA